MPAPGKRDTFVISAGIVILPGSSTFRVILPGKQEIKNIIVPAIQQAGVGWILIFSKEFNPCANSALCSHSSADSDYLAVHI